MSPNASHRPELFLRLGSHAEKEYFLKTIKFYDGIIVGANLVEATPGATASLLLKLNKDGKKILIDPITYAFGIGIKYLKTEKVRKKTGEIVVQIKPSFVKLAKKYGSPYLTAVTKDRSVEVSDFDDATLDQSVQAIGNFQLNRIRDEFASDPELKSFADDAPEPDAIFSPYLHCSAGNFDALLKLNIRFLEATVKHFTAAKVYAVLCIDRELLSNDAFLTTYRDKIKALGLPAIWFWISDFDETRAMPQELQQFRKAVESFSGVCKVYNLHGGYFSICLNKLGMAGISHGVGYGESKDVIPVLSRGQPSVRYHLPPLHRRCGVPEIERSFEGLAISSADEFYKNICDCIVCKGVLAGQIEHFGQFGEFFPSRGGSGRQSQTPASAKRCRYHFLFSRRQELDSIASKSIAEIVDGLRKAEQNYIGIESIPDKQKSHLGKWAGVLA